jgi:polyphosphate kinase 2 (PPK2 family)
VNLRSGDPADTRPFGSNQKAAGQLEDDIARLVALQEQLYAQDRWSVLLIFQAMDAAGKDSAIKHVIRGHQRIRALSGPQRDADPEVLPSRIKGRAAATVPGAP